MRSRGWGRRLAAGALAALLVIGLSGCRQQGETPAGAPEGLNLAVEADMAAGVLHAGASGGWQDTLSHLEYTSLTNVTAQGLEPGDDLAGWDLVVADPELLEEADWADIMESLMDYVEQGGLLVLDNAFWDQFPAEFLGISGGAALDTLPTELTWPEVEENLSEFQGVLRDFAALYPSYKNGETLAGRDYGYGFTVTTARAIAQAGELALYTLNDVGEGQVLLTNPMLPNGYSISSPTLLASGEEQ